MKWLGVQSEECTRTPPFRRRTNFGPTRFGGSDLSIFAAVSDWRVRSTRLSADSFTRTGHSLFDQEPSHSLRKQTQESLVPWETRLGSAVPSESRSMHSMPWHGRGMALLINSVHQSQNTDVCTLPPIKLLKPPLPVGLHHVVFSRLYFQRFSVLLKLKEAPVVQRGADL